MVAWQRGLGSRLLSTSLPQYIVAAWAPCTLPPVRGMPNKVIVYKTKQRVVEYGVVNHRLRERDSHSG